jgi:hypothetical protein
MPLSMSWGPRLASFGGNASLNLARNMTMNWAGSAGSIRRVGTRRRNARRLLTAMAGSSASTSSWGGSGARGCFRLGEDMDDRWSSGAEDRPEVERADGESRGGGGGERGRPSSDEGGEESGDEFWLMVSTLERSREGGGARWGRSADGGRSVAMEK